MTTTQAKKLISIEASNRGLTFTKLTAKTVSFSDLARADCIFVSASGCNLSLAWSEVKQIAVDNGFRFSCQ